MKYRKNTIYKYDEKKIANDILNELSKREIISVPFIIDYQFVLLPSVSNTKISEIHSFTFNKLNVVFI